jgi:hypothetical protein
MASDDIVQPVGRRWKAPGLFTGSATRQSAPDEVTPTPGVSDAAAPAPLPPALRFVTSALGLTVSAICLFGAFGVAMMGADFPPVQVFAAMLVLCGVVIVPPVVSVARRLSPVFGSLWLPPLVFVVIFMAARPVSMLAAPHGAAREAYIAKSLAAAEKALKANDPVEADNRMFGAENYAGDDPAVKSIQARIERARAARLAAPAAAKPPIDPAKVKDAPSSVAEATPATTAPATATARHKRHRRG